MFTDEQKAALGAKLDRSNVKQRKQGAAQVSYVEGWHAIAEANRIFGFDAWSRETFELRAVSERERKIGAQQKDGWGVSYLARVRVSIGAVVREGVGVGHGIDVDLGQAHESAAKEAETDAMKRALMTFGNPFGLALYDKEQENVADAAPEPPAAPPDRKSPPGLADSLMQHLARATDPADLESLWKDPDFQAKRAQLSTEDWERLNGHARMIRKKWPA